MQIYTQLIALLYDLKGKLQLNNRLSGGSFPYYFNVFEFRCNPMSKSWPYTLNGPLPCFTPSYHPA